MPLVGCLVPICAQLHVCNTDTGEFDVYGDDDTTSPHNPKSVRHIIENLLNSLQLSFDVLTIVHPGHRDVDVNEIYTMAHGYSMDVYIIPSLMARFMAVFSQLKLTLHKFWSFAMITHAAGADCHVIRSFARDTGGFKVVQDTYQHPGVVFDPTKFTCKPEKVVYVTFEYGHPGRPVHHDYPVPLPEGYPFDRAHFRDFASMLFEGGLAKARQIVGHGRFPLMADFVDTIAAVVNGETYHIFKLGYPIPAETKFRKMLKSKSVVQIKSGMMLIFDGICMKRISLPMHRGNYPPGYVEISISVDSYGLVTFMDASPTDSGSAKSPLVSAGSPLPLKSAKVQKESSESMPPVKRTVVSAPVEVKEPWKYQNVIGYEFMSTKFILHDDDGTPIEVAADGVAEIEPGTPLTSTLVHDHIEAVFSRLPRSAADANVLVISHDGNCSSSWIGIAVDVASFYLSLEAKVYVIYDTIAYSRVALRHLNWSPSDGSDTVFLVMVNGTYCRYVILERSKESGFGWGIVESVKLSFATTSELANLLSSALDRYPNTTTRLLLTDRAPLSLQQQTAKLSIRILRVKSFDTALMEGILDFADSVADSDVPGYRRQRDITSPVYFKQDFGAMQELANDGEVTFSQNVMVDPSLGGFKVFQRISTFSSYQYVLFEASAVPEDCNSVQVIINNEPFSFPIVRIVPSMNNADPMITFKSHMPTEISASSSVASLQSMVEEKPKFVKPLLSKEETEAIRYKHLKSAGAEISISFDIASSTAVIDFVGKTGFEVITDWNGNKNIPFVVSFANESPSVGVSALVDFKEHPDRVVWDLFHILGRNVNEVIVNPKWTFDIMEATRFDNTAMIAFETTKGRVMTAPSGITAMFLRAIQKLVVAKTGINPRRFFFHVPPLSTSRVHAMVKEACNVAGITFSGSNNLKSS
uniref:Lactamase_B domain-containing protein n=1 Tax=Panagrellus redivivus TaxID=6233 RepID=A0A7E4VGC3_PANRE